MNARHEPPKTNERTAKRARPPALHAAVSTVAAPGLGSLVVLADGTRLACAGHSIRVLAPSGLLSVLAGNNTRLGNQDGPGPNARSNCPISITVDPAGNVVVVDSDNHALRLVSKAGVVSTLAVGGGPGFADWQGAAARFKYQNSVSVTATGDYVMTDFGNNAVRVVTPGSIVRTLAGNGEPGFVNRQVDTVHFNCLHWPGGGRGQLHSGDQPLQPLGSACDEGGGWDGEHGCGQQAERV